MAKLKSNPLQTFTLNTPEFQLFGLKTKALYDLISEDIGFLKMNLEIKSLNNGVWESPININEGYIKNSENELIGLKFDIVKSFGNPHGIKIYKIWFKNDPEYSFFCEEEPIYELGAPGSKMLGLYGEDTEVGIKYNIGEIPNYWFPPSGKLGKLQFMDSRTNFVFFTLDQLWPILMNHETFNNLLISGCQIDPGIISSSYSGEIKEGPFFTLKIEVEPSDYTSSKITESQMSSPLVIYGAQCPPSWFENPTLLRIAAATSENGDAFIKNFINLKESWLYNVVKCSESVPSTSDDKG